MNTDSTLISPVSGDRLRHFQTLAVLRAHTQEGDIAELTQLDGNLHSVDDRPSYTEISINTGNPLVRVWHSHGLKSRIGKPSSLGYYPSGKPLYAAWYVDGLEHRIGGASLEEFDEETGLTHYAEYMQCGKMFRPDGAAMFSIDLNRGITTFEQWHTKPLFDLPHRDDGDAAIIHRDLETNIPYRKLWVLDGKLERRDGEPPVEIRDPKSGELLEQKWGDQQFLKMFSPEPNI